MAKGNIFLGQVSGKIGDVIMKKNAGRETVIQVRPSSYTRKKATYSQCRAQAIAVTSSKIYSIFKDVIGDSWQKTITLSKVYAKFLKKANTRQKKLDVEDRRLKLPFSESKARYVPKDSNPIVPANIQVADGTWPNNFQFIEGLHGFQLPKAALETDLEDYLRSISIYQGMIITFCVINVSDRLATIVDNRNEPGFTSYTSSAFYRQFVVNMPSSYERQRPMSVAQWVDCLQPFYADNSLPLLSQRVLDPITLSSFGVRLSTRAEGGAGALAVILKNPSKKRNSTSYFHLINRQCFGIDNRAVKDSYAYQWDVIKLQ